MRLQIFQSDKGDCLLLESKDGKRILCDGGMSRSMKAHVRDELAQLRKAGKRLDYVYVSHIDQDHISGILQLLNDELEWRVYDHHHQGGDNSVKKPRVPRPPEIGGLWHNAFRDLIKDNLGDIESMLAAVAPVLLGTGIPDAMKAGSEMQTISLSIPEALKVSKLASEDLLGIPINKVPGVPGKRKLLLLRDESTDFHVGSLKLTVVGPTSEGLDNLREGWNNWLRSAENRASVRSIREEMRKRVDEFGNGGLNVTPFDMRDWNGIPDFEGVTAPNIASLMFMVEEDGKRLLLTGDSQQDVLLECLRKADYLDEGYLHLDILKAQHHASENNFDDDFCRQVSARHYVFCGNGANGNPEPSVIKMIFDSRLGSKSKQALAPDAKDEPFEFWFSTTSAQQNEGSKEQANFEAVEELVRDLKKKANGRLKAHFNTKASTLLEI